MVDSLTKDLIDVLTAGTWTTEPAVINVLSSKQNMIGLARKNQAANGSTLIIMPPEMTVEYTEGVKTEAWRFEAWLFYFADAFSDATYDVVQDQLDDLLTVLAAGTPPTGFDNFYVDRIQDMTNRHDRHYLHVIFINIEKYDGTAGIGGNTLWLKNLITTNWDASLITAPTMASWIQKRKHYASGNYIFYRMGSYTADVIDINNKFRNETETFILTLVANSEANLALMKHALARVINEDFYPSGSYMNLDDKTLVLLHMNEGTGTTCDNAEGTAAYDFTFGAAEDAPSWGGSGFCSTNSIKIIDDGEYIYNTNLFSHSTNYPCPPNGTIELYFKLTGSVAAGAYFFRKEGVATNYIVLYNLSSQLTFRIQLLGESYTAAATIPDFKLNIWYKIMVTWGARGMELFLDNNLIGTGTFTGYFNKEGTTIDFLIPNATASEIKGYVDEFRLSNVQRGPYGKLEMTEGTVRPFESGWVMDIVIKGRRYDVYG